LIVVGRRFLGSTPKVPDMANSPTGETSKGSALNSLTSPADLHMQGAGSSNLPIPIGSQPPPHLGGFTEAVISSSADRYAVAWRSVAQ
jgi:hypothetical protein